ncbi:MAG: hypothetical protein FJ319_12320 [SAR202 cluster bacterium]|nr:hypothetical protein [SAR202 cluster bacterium]
MPRTVWSWAILAASLALALAVYYGVLGSGLINVIARWTAEWTSVGLNLFGTETLVRGTILASGTFAVNVVAECTSVGPLILYLGAVIAFPATVKAKLIGAALGVAVLTCINVFRIMTLFWIGDAYPEYLNIAHLLVWQTAIILLAIVLWLVWVEKLVGTRNR